MLELFRFLFDESHPAHEKYKKFLKGYKSKNTSTENEAQNKRKRKNRWDEAAPSTSTEQQGPQPGSSSASDSTDIMAEFQRAKLLIQQKAAEARAKLGVLPVDVERQKQIETQQEVCEIKEHQIGKILKLFHSLITSHYLH